MTHIEVSPHVEDRELPPITHPSFVLLLGPSGVGKSVILRELANRDPRFCLNPVYMNRPQRLGESEKIPLSDEEIEKLKAEGQLLADNFAYGNRYVIRTSDIKSTLELGRIPMQDYPVDLVENILVQGLPTLTLYIAPPDLTTWKERLAQDGRDVDGLRLKAGIAEIRQMAMNGYTHPLVDETIVNDDLRVSVDRAQQLIYRQVSRV